jgi:ABC-type sugar transport system ATPase subunit
VLEARDIDKSYGGVVALSGAGLRVRAGSVHALLGENGAGKSTLVKVIAGAVEPDAGVLRLDGEQVSFASTAKAARSGVAVVSQELSLFPDLDVLSNLYPMREPRVGPFIKRAEMWRRARPVLAELGLELHPRQLVETLSLAERQLVEIAKALITEPRVLILDEPTSALETKSTEALMKVLRVLRERQVAVIFVSHILEEVMALCDRITVLRDGRVVLEGVSREGLSIGEVVGAMLGERGKAQGNGAEAPELELQAVAEAVEAVADAVEAADDVAPDGDADHDVVLEDVEIEGVLNGVALRASPREVVGLAGLAGSGHDAVFELLSGQRRLKRGSARLPGKREVRRGLRRAIDSGIALVSGDRKRFGLMLDKPIWENVAQVRSVALAREGLLIRSRPLRRRARELVAQLEIRTSSVDEPAGSLSGGNQQKLVFAKWLNAQPSVLLLDDPTRGVDVGAKAEMHALIRAAADGGAIVLLASTDIDELAEVCDRVVVFFQGQICADLTGEVLQPHAVLEAMNTGNRAGSGS